MDEFEDFHITAQRDESERVVELLRSAGVRCRERMDAAVGRPEYVIEVHRDDIEAAGAAFWTDVGPGRTFTSDGT